MPLRVCTGFEFGPIATLAGLIKGNSGSRIVDTGSGTPSINGTLARTGTYSLEINPAAGIEYVQWTTATLGVSQTRCVLAFAFQFPTLPSADVLIAAVDGTTAAAVLYFRNSDDKLVASTGAIGAGLAGPTIVAATWYYVELYFNTVINPNTVDWWVNGVPQTQVSAAVAAGTIAAVSLGDDTTAQSMTCRYDDVAVWTDTANIAAPMGAHKIVRLLPDTAGTAAEIGTANAMGRMVTNSAIDATFNSANIIAAIREVPPLLGSTASGVGQRVLSTTSAVGIPMTSYTLLSGEAIAGVRILVAGWAASATTNSLGLRVFNGTTEEILFATGDPNFDALDPCAWLVRQVVGTSMFDAQTKLDAMQVRIGYSGDITPLPGAHAIYAEVAIKEAVASIAPAAVTVTASVGTLTVAGTTPTQNLSLTGPTVTATAGTLTPLSLAVIPGAITVTAAVGTVGLTGTTPAQNVFPAAVTATVTPGTLSVRQNIATPAGAVLALPGTVTIGRAQKFLTESFAKVNGAPLGPDLVWRRQTTVLTGAAEWGVLSGQAQFTAAPGTNQADLQVPIDYLGGVDQTVSVDIQAFTTTATPPYEFSVALYNRFESFEFGGQTHYRGYVVELAQDDLLFPGTVGWRLTFYALNTSLAPPNNALLLELIAGGFGAVTPPCRFAFSVIGDELTVDIIQPTPVHMSINDTTFTDGRYVAMSGHHLFDTGETGTVTVDNFRAAIVQNIIPDPEPVTVTAVPGTVTLTGGGTFPQTISMMEVAVDVIEADDNPPTPTDLIDGGNSATPAGDLIATEGSVIVQATPGSVIVNLGASGQNIAATAPNVAATPGTVTLVRQLIINPAPVTVTVSPAVLFLGDVVIQLIPGIEIGVTDHANVVVVADSTNDITAADTPNEVMVTDPGNAVTAIDHAQSVSATR